MSSQIYNSFITLKPWFRCQQCRWVIVYLILFLWCETMHDAMWCSPGDNSTNLLLLSNLRNDLTAKLNNQSCAKLETKPDTTNSKENIMGSFKNFRALKIQSDKGKIATDDFFDCIKPLIGTFSKPVPKIHITGRRILFEMLLVVLCVSMAIPYDRFTRKSSRIFDRDVATSTISKSRRCSINKHTQFSFLDEFYTIPRVTAHIYPFTINQYANDIVKEQKTAEELMKYEWSRYLSFKNFPLDCHMMPIRLAQAGFYYTGHDQEVKCFSCGIINRDWTSDETAVQVHKRLSPGCQFIRGENTDNVEIHAKEFYNGMFDITSHNGNSGQKSARSTSRTSSGTVNSDISASFSTSGANGGPDDTLNNTLPDENNRNLDPNQTMNHSNNNAILHNNTAAPPSQSTRKGQSRQTSANTMSSLSPKHPQYMELAARASSFIGWTLLDIQDPVELAQAGFFYTGVKDFVRCYYCGVGLKNWERVDNPWTEHSRWSHGCGHLLSSRADGGSGSDMATWREDSVPTPPAVNQQKKGALPGHGGSDRSTGTGGCSDMDSAAARSLMDMGYTHEQVKTAVRKYREQNGTQPMTAVALVGLFEAEESLGDAASLPPQFQTAGHSASGRPSPSNPSSIDQANRQHSNIGDKSNNSHSHTHAEKGPERRTSNKTDDTKKHSINSEGEESLLEESRELKSRMQCKICLSGLYTVISCVSGAKSLLEENRELKSRMQCKICLDRNANMIFLPCGHMVACQTCAVPLRKCAICRKLIKGSVRVYQS